MYRARLSAASVRRVGRYVGPFHCAFGYGTITSVKAYVGVTDGEWYRYLAAAGTDEVNFWRPSGDRAFRALDIGEPFFFKLHAPDNRVVGGGYFSGFAGLRLSEAWRFFGPANGTSSVDEMRTRIAKYRREPLAPGDDPQIGCVFIRDVTFFAPAEHSDAPPDFAPNIVQGKGYDLDREDYASYFAPLMARLAGVSHRADITWTGADVTFAEAMSKRRLGQRAFQGVVLSAYRGRCAITGDRIRPVLQAAHVRPVSEGGQHRLDNGMLLRSDVHTLFDAGYLGVDPRFQLRVSSRLRDEFGNGEEFYVRAASGEPIAVPDRRVDRPSRDYLEWHMDEVFQAS